MNRLEMIYQEHGIEIYIKSDLISNEFILTNEYKVIARYISPDFRYIHLECKKVKLEHLKKFDEVVTEYLIKAL